MVYKPTNTAWWFGTMEFYDFPYIGTVVIPTDEVHHFSEGGRSTTNQISSIPSYVRGTSRVNPLVNHYNK